MTFPAPLVQPSLLGGKRTAAFVPPGGGTPAAPAPAPTGPGGVVSTFTQAPAGGGAMTLQALMARQKEAAARQQANLQQPQGTILGGLGQMTNALFSGLEQNRAAKEEAVGREEVVNAITGINPETGIATPEQLGAIGRRDPELMIAMYQQQMENLRAQAKEKQEGGLKETDVGAMADDFASVPDVKNYQNAQSMWVSLQDAATRDTPQADLNMVIALAKLFDPTSVVRTEEGKMVELTGDAPSSVKAQFMYLIGAPGSRLSRKTRQGMMEEAYSRMNGYYRGVQEASNWFTEKAGRRGYNPQDIVRPFEAPAPFDPEKIVGSDDEAATPNVVHDSSQPTNLPDGTEADGADGKTYVATGGKWVAKE